MVSPPSATATQSQAAGLWAPSGCKSCLHVPACVADLSYCARASKLGPQEQDGGVRAPWASRRPSSLAGAPTPAARRAADFYAAAIPWRVATATCCGQSARARKIETPQCRLPGCHCSAVPRTAHRGATATATLAVGVGSGSAVISAVPLCHWQCARCAHTRRGAADPCRGANNHAGLARSLS